MARVVTAQPIPAPPAGLELSPIPNLRSADAAAKWIAEHLGIQVSRYYIRDKTTAGQIRYSIIRGVRHYSSQDLYDFIMTRRKATP